MFFKKSKTLIYIILSFLLLSFIIPVISYAITDDSIYVWSNSSSSINTSTTPENSNTDSASQENGR